METSDQRKRIATHPMGVAVLEQAKNTGNAEPVGNTVSVDVAADMMNEVAQRAAEKAVTKVIRNGHGNGNGKKKDYGEWIRWGLGLLIIVAGILWGGAFLFAERPTKTETKEMIQEAKAQHPDSKDGIKANEKAITEDRLHMSKIEGKLDSMSSTLGEIKDDLKDLKKHRGR